MKSLLILGGVLVLGIGGWVATRPAPDPATASAPAEGAPIVTVSLPAALSPEAEIGKRGYEAVCISCHGENAAGREGFGPPLVHIYYEPSHHADMAFVLAVQNGVRAHHWSFGDMPPQEGLTRADVAAITAYVRELQRANGIN
ncbi:MAG: cytochrome c [Maritimibacter sp.]|nr:cytochrome c [Maritimibacter sp.]